MGWIIGTPIMIEPIYNALHARVPIIPTILGGGTSFLLAEVALPAASAVTIGAIVGVSTVLAAIAGSWPKIIAAKASARLSETDRIEREFNATLERVHASYESQIHVLQFEVQRHHKIIGQERKSKHALVDAWNNAMLHYRDVIERLRLLQREHNMPVDPDYTFPTYRELIGPQDDEIARILSDSLSPPMQQNTTVNINHERA
jgi:hypothetical protein